MCHWCAVHPTGCAGLPDESHTDFGLSTWHRQKIAGDTFPPRVALKAAFPQDTDRSTATLRRPKPSEGDLRLYNGRHGCAWLLHAKECFAMCDYSLHTVTSRPAKVGDKLVTTKFKNSLTGGFAAVEEPTVAVCLLPGTEVAFETEVDCEHVFRVFRSQKLISGKVARFRQINLEEPNVHHDALEFPDGQVVLLTRLCEGQHATVLQLPASPRATNEAEPQKRGSLVT